MKEREGERESEGESKRGFFGVQKLYERLQYIHTNDHQTHEHPWSHFTCTTNINTCLLVTIYYVRS